MIHSSSYHRLQSKSSTHPELHDVRQGAQEIPSDPINSFFPHLVRHFKLLCGQRVHPLEQTSPSASLLNINPGYAVVSTCSLCRIKLYIKPVVIYAILKKLDGLSANKEVAVSV